MTPGPQALCAETAALARTGERVEVFARRTATVMTRLSPGRPPHDQVAVGWLVGVRSVRDGQCGLAAASELSRAALAGALEDARQIRELAPRPWDSGPPEAVGAGPAPDPGQPPLAALEPAREAARQAADLLGGEPVTITAGATARTVLRCDSAGWSGSYAQREAQLHVRSAAAGLDAAQGARIRSTAAGLPAAETVAEYLRCRRHLSAAPAPVPSLDWVALSPLVVARMVSRLSRGFLRTAARQVTDGMPAGAVTLVDDGRPGSGPAGAPFDDEGTPRQRTVVLGPGGRALLGSRGAGPTTGNGHWADWAGEITVATTNCFLEPTCQEAAAAVLARPGWGFAAEDLRGFRSGLDLASPRVEFELGGAVLREGDVTASGRLAVSVPAREFPGRLRRVLPGTEFYRITGIFGGSWCLADGSLGRNDE